MGWWGAATGGRPGEVSPESRKSGGFSASDTANPPDLAQRLRSRQKSGRLAVHSTDFVPDFLTALTTRLPAGAEARRSHTSLDARKTFRSREAIRQRSLRKERRAELPGSTGDRFQTLRV